MHHQLKRNYQNIPQKQFTKFPNQVLLLVPEEDVAKHNFLSSSFVELALFTVAHHGGDDDEWVDEGPEHQLGEDEPDAEGVVFLGVAVLGWVLY